MTTAKVKKKDPSEPVTTKQTPARKPKKESSETPKKPREDEFGNLYLEELDLLRWLNKRLRIQACRHQADALRTRAENIELKMTEETRKHRNTASSFERAAKKHEEESQEHLTELSKKYGIDFKSPDVLFDDESGKISAIDSEKGLPKL